MTDEEIPKDVSLLRCTVKKSQQVFAKIVLLVSYAIVALAFLGCGYLLFTGVLIPIISPVVTAILSIPWYYYVAGIAILAIPVYSFLWCIARELTDEDWNSREAENIAAIVALAAATIAAIAATIAVAFAATIAAVVIATIAVAVATTIAAVVIATIAGSAAVAPLYCSINTNNKLMRFPGAYLHYRRRTKS